ncbi:hypothetical protein DFH08DRAFT_833355 [Mycena albidolilacea]|uniref:Protein kinase domain-containing protein n=1 Tax=Mycena albidolilacea TaxID=1033008 RepID=A0AAD7AW87_9AGAR|nr:hypothetical protein DFH08DRAFT_833355 [Mycena albidolilacea]
MALQPHSEPEFTVVSTTNNAGSAPYSGAFFPGAAGFTIGGGDFTSNVTNNVYNPPPEQPAAFRTILLGDIKLLKEIRVNDESGVVGRQSQRTNARRMYYSAKIVGGEPGPVTVALYQRDDTEEEWRQHITKYESIRHPKIMQLYGLMSTKGLRGLVFHDELIPFLQFFSRFEYSPLLITYICAYCEAMRYCSSMDIDTDYSIWIRPATGELCVNLVWYNGAVAGIDAGVEVPRMENVSLDNPRAESTIISALDQGDFYALCSSLFSKTELRAVFISTETLIPLWTVLHLDSPRKASTITDPLGINGASFDIHLEHDGEVLPSSWMRFDSNRAQYPEFRLSAYAGPLKVNDSEKFWMAQANHFFAQLETTSNFKDYVLVKRVQFILRCLPNIYNTHKAEGYLFVSPAEEFPLGPYSFQWPYRPAYWSLSPSGTFPLSTEDANMLGFPIIHIETCIQGYFSDDRFYGALRRFQQGKGLNPESQETAINFGYLLYKLSDEEVPLTCVEVEARRDGIQCDLKDTALCQKLGHYL